MRKAIARFLIALEALIGASFAHGDDVDVAVDVGHSSAHPGAMSARGVPEFQFNASLARVVESVLTSASTRTVLIGNEGGLSDLKVRVSVANSSGARYLISIHHDSVQPQYLSEWTWQGQKRMYCDRFSGFSLFVSRENPFFSKSLDCASAVGQALRKRGFSPSSQHAEPISGEARTWADEKNGVYYYDQLAVLRRAVQPAFLLEAGIIVNRSDEETLMTAEMQQNIAESILDGLRMCDAERLMGHSPSRSQ